MVLVASALAGDWQSTLTPDVAGPFSPIRPFEAEYRIGWTDVEAARARIAVSKESPEVIKLSASGATTGLARALWQLDATMESTTAADGLRTIYTEQKERYINRSIFTQIVSRPDGIWRIRENVPQGENAARWKRIKISPLRDLFSGMLFIRSQRLAPGDQVSTIIFPGDSPYFVEIRAAGTGPINVAGARRDAIRLELQIRRINLKEGARLEPHGKFRSGTVWLSNDADRVPLRAEMEIFIGYVFAELDSIRFDNH